MKTVSLYNEWFSEKGVKGSGWQGGPTGGRWGEWVQAGVGRDHRRKLWVASAWGWGPWEDLGRLSHGPERNLGKNVEKRLSFASGYATVLMLSHGSYVARCAHPISPAYVPHAWCSVVLLSKDMFSVRKEVLYIFPCVYHFWFSSILGINPGFHLVLGSCLPENCF